MPFFNSNNNDRQFFSAQTNISSASTFNASIICLNNGSVRWEFPDGVSQTTGTTYYRIPGNGVRLVKAVVNREKNIRQISFPSSFLIGNVKVFESDDIVYNQIFASEIILNSNPQLSGLTLPTVSNRTVRTINISSCNFSGQVDFSTIDFSGPIGNNLILATDNNTRLNSILLKDVQYTNPISRIEIDDCSIGSGGFSSDAPVGKINFNKTIDLSKFSALGGQLILTNGLHPHGNSGITSVLFPPSVSGNNFSRIHLNGLPNYTGNSYNLDLNWAGNKLSGFMVFNRLPLITGFTSFSSVTNFVSQFDMANCNLQGSLNLTNFTRLNGLFYVNNNTGLTAINFNSTTGNSFSQLDVSNTGLKNLNLSVFTNIGDYIINFTDCPNFTGLTLPNNLNQAFGCYLPYLYNSDFRDLDFSQTHLAHPFGTRLYCYNNPNLTGFTFPAETVNNSLNFYNFMFFENCSIKKFIIENLSGTNHNVLQVRLQNNGMTAGIVNEILTKFDNTGWSGNTLDISGTNAAPDTTSGGFNGVAARLSLSGKSWTVTTS